MLDFYTARVEQITIIIDVFGIVFMGIALITFFWNVGKIIRGEDKEYKAYLWQGIIVLGVGVSIFGITQFLSSIIIPRETQRISHVAENKVLGPELPNVYTNTLRDASGLEEYFYIWFR